MSDLKLSEIMRPNEKEEIKDQEIVLERRLSNDADIFRRKRLVRVFAINKEFYNISFQQSVLDDCYFRNCTFNNCNFTGAQLTHSYFKGSKFIDCIFKYATFERTIIERDILRYNLPDEPNLKQQVVRSLRVNYQSLGDHDGVNAAIRVELEATLEHYHKAVFSSEKYYRDKYRNGASRFKYIMRYFSFWTLHLLWGNGERPSKLLMVSLIVWTTGVGVGIFDNKFSVLVAMERSFAQIVLGTGLDLSLFLQAVFNLVRYIILGLFIASLTKRLMRR